MQSNVTPSGTYDHGHLGKLVPVNGRRGSARQPGTLVGIGAGGIYIGLDAEGYRAVTIKPTTIVGSEGGPGCEMQQAKWSVVLLVDLETEGYRSGNGPVRISFGAVFLNGQA